MTVLNADILKQRKRINRKLTQAANANASAVLNVVAEELSLMNGVNMATALHRIARHCVKGEAGPDGAAPEAKKEVEAHPAFAALLRTVEQQAEMSLLADHDMAEEILPAQCASIIAWSLACLDIHNDRLLVVLATLAQPRLHEFKFYEVTNMLWAYAKLRAGGLAPQLISAIAQRLAQRCPGEYKAHCLSLAVWAFSEVHWPDETLMASLADELAGQAETLQPQEICNICWALAGRLTNRRLYETVHLAFMQGDVLRRCKAEEFSNFMLAITAGHLVFPGFFAKAGATVVRLAKSMKPKHIASTLSAVSAAGQSLPELSSLLDVATEQVFQFQPHELAATAKAAAKLYPDHPGFFKACTTNLIMKLSELSVENLTDLIDAFTNCSDAQASNWAMYWLLQERQRRPGIGVGRTGATVASTVASTGEERSFDRDTSDNESAGSGESQTQGSPLRLKGCTPQSPPELGLPWKVVSLRPPPGLEPVGFKQGTQTYLADSVSFFTL